MNKRARWRPSKSVGRMNATEQRFEASVLYPRALCGEIEKCWTYESHKFRLADNTFYTPDFVVYRADGLIELIDVKGSGGWEQHTRIKFKVAAELYPRYVWVAYVETKTRGEFIREEL